VRRARALARAPPGAEPRRNKTHWDHLLEEAEWMAKEFQRCVRACVCVCGCACVGGCGGGEGAGSCVCLGAQQLVGVARCLQKGLRGWE
jgi:hypothetical protein